MLWTVIKLLFFLVIISGVGLVGYAYLGPIFFPQDFAAPTIEVIRPVILGDGE